MTEYETPALEIDGLGVRLSGGQAARPILDGVSLRVGAGETVGLVGESGSGKSVACRSVLGLLPAGARTSGEVRVAGRDVLTMKRAELAELRSGQVSMIFQDPRASVNPLRRVGDFLTEGLRGAGTPAAVAESRAEELLDAVGIRDPRGALRRYPHQFSGGMLQRVVIAAALAGEPALLVADEPTTALDVTTQAEIIAILTRLQAARGTGMLFVTHDLELASAICDRVYVMYAGRIVETSGTDALFDRPRHPYTAGLLACTPRIEAGAGAPRPIPGRPVSLAEAPPGCAFAARCAHAQPRCSEETPELAHHGDGLAACHRADEGIRL
ncbi:ABC transporter ATP-binding protein [Streptomyces sp. NBC_01387]|uniref:ABC transporter ATP-binding protein n=1 Tax=unclassified Streptomyces TaxID=2593676 RepID=UPI0020241FC9|nr:MULTISPECIES: ABC transporter ATP-binding protein [unclassified Streptomyces]MCX4553727.1 ABC transporter ATP-binding protein [Streptomyces sp. NBC_01500]WSC18651.1 ABC transporter ATP-binding protein [Streptomyces sp. NBC_01766]WSV52685.1 ABC transporter ATP-binding protein [Streptomyces sp. NBC_01014]